MSNIRQFGRIPVFATIVVLAAVATMIGLGIWQLERLQWKEALLDRYAQAARSTEPVAFPLADSDPHRWLYRRSALDCRNVLSTGAVSGRSADGQAGWALTARCAVDGGEAEVVLGWTLDPAPREWAGDKVAGTIAPLGEGGVRLIADPPLAGLAAMGAPNPAEIPNNHLAYAFQWFFFAATALVIYGLALKRRLAQRGEQG
ncbi:SURF1 family protein [Croceicoccus ponticola]|nr:SURF1 family protein [Croceicoccus ponticola]